MHISAVKIIIIFLMRSAALMESEQPFDCQAINNNKSAFQRFVGSLNSSMQALAFRCKKCASEFSTYS